MLIMPYLKKIQVETGSIAQWVELPHKKFNTQDYINCACMRTYLKKIKIKKKNTSLRKVIYIVIKTAFFI